MVGTTEIALEGALDSQITIPNVKIPVAAIVASASISAKNAFDHARIAVTGKLEAIQERGRIADLLCDSNRYGLAVLKTYGLEIAVDEKTKEWMLRDLGDVENLTAIPQEEIYEHLQQIIITSPEPKEKTAESSVDEAVELSKKMLPLYAVTTSAAILAFIACAPAAMAVLGAGSVARTVNNSHRYLAVRAEYDDLNFIDQARVQSRMLSASAASNAGIKMMLPKFVELASFGALNVGGQGMMDQLSETMGAIISDGLAPLDMLEVSSIDVEAEAPARGEAREVKRSKFTYNSYMGLN